MLMMMEVLVCMLMLIEVLACFEWGGIDFKSLGLSIDVRSSCAKVPESRDDKGKRPLCLSLEVSRFHLQHLCEVVVFYEAFIVVLKICSL